MYGNVFPGALFLLSFLLLGSMYLRITSPGYMAGEISPVDGVGHVSSRDNDRIIRKIVYEFFFLSYYRRRELVSQ